jgi:hypothetical protein
MNNKQIIYGKQKMAIPCQLKSTQEWFAGIITNRLSEDQSICPQAPSGMLIAEEAAKYIAPSPNLRPHQRMQIYNQQYWWRLLKALHDNFPLLTRLFGYHAFNEEIAIPYLMKYPPNHWSLIALGDRLPKWIQEEYSHADRPLILNAVQLDWAFTDSFVSAQNAPLNLPNLIQDNSQNLLSHVFYLQPYIHLFKWDYDLLSFRDAFLKEKVEYWTENDFPSLLKEKTYYFILYRSPKNHVISKEISAGEYLLLNCFKNGSTLESACELLEQQDTFIYEQAASHLQQWFQDWTIRNWLTLES